MFTEDTNLILGSLFKSYVSIDLTKCQQNFHYFHHEGTFFAAGRSSSTFKTLDPIMNHQPTPILTVNFITEQYYTYLLIPYALFSQLLQYWVCFSLLPNKFGGQFHRCLFREEKRFSARFLSKGEKMELSTNTGVVAITLYPPPHAYI